MSLPPKFSRRAREMRAVRVDRADGQVSGNGAHGCTRRADGVVTTTRADTRITLLRPASRPFATLANHAPRSPPRPFNPLYDSPPAKSFARGGGRGGRASRGPGGNPRGNTGTYMGGNRPRRENGGGRPFDRMSQTGRTCVPSLFTRLGRGKC